MLADDEMVDLIIIDMDFESYEIKIIFKKFYTFLQVYMHKKKCNGKKFNKIEYFQLPNSNDQIFRILILNHTKIFKTLRRQHVHEKLMSIWKIWYNGFRQELFEFFCDYADYGKFKRGMIIENICLEEDFTSQLGEDLSISVAISSTPLTTTKPILPFGQRIQPTYKSLFDNSESRYKMIAGQITRTELTENSSLDQARLYLSQPPSIPISLEDNQTNSRSNIKSVLKNDVTKLNSVPNNDFTNKTLNEIKSGPLMISNSSEQINNPMPSTPSGSTTVSQYSPIRRDSRKQKSYKVISINENVNQIDKEATLKQLKILPFSGQMIYEHFKELSDNEIYQARSTATKMPAILQTAPSYYEEFFNEISDVEEDLSQVFVREDIRRKIEQENFQSLIVMRSLLPDLHQNESQSNLIRAISPQFLNSENELKTIDVVCDVHDFRPAPEQSESPNYLFPKNNQNVISNKDIIAPDPSMISSNEIFVEESQLKNDMLVEAVSTLDLNNQNVIQNQDRDALDSPIKLLNVEAKNRSCINKDRNWVEILRVRPNTEIDMKALCNLTNKKQKTRRRKKPPTDANRELEEQLIQQPERLLASKHVNAIPENVIQNDSFNQIIEALDEINTSINLTEKALFTPTNHKFTTFKTKFMEWQESYSASNSQKYQEFLKISTDVMTEDSNALLNLIDIIQLYLVKEDDITFEDLINENSSPERKKQKLDTLKGLKDYEIIEILNSLSKADDTVAEE